MLTLAGAIGAGLVGALYAAAADVVRAEASTQAAVAAIATWPAGDPDPAPIPEGRDVPEERLATIDPDPEVIVDPETGVRLGPLAIRWLPDPAGPIAASAADSADPSAPIEADPAEPSPPTRAARRPTRTARRSPPPASIPRLHPDPGRHVIATARGMMARNEAVQGSCYRYLSEVFARAGHEGWRTRRVVYREGLLGPYADLDLIRPGDWLYIVNHPESTPVGTHSVLFVSWDDRARGYAQVIEHSGWGAPSAGDERSYDVSRTYRIVRPILTR